MAKLQNAASTNSPSSSKPATPPPQVAPPKPKPIPPPTPKSSQPPTKPVQPPIIRKRAPPTPSHLDLPTWEHETIGHVFNVTLDVRIVCLFRMTQCLFPNNRKRLPRGADGRLCGSRVWHRNWSQRIQVRVISKLLQSHDGYSLSIAPALVACLAVRKPFRLTADLADRLLIARLEIDSQAMSYVSDHPHLL